jgi:uncharacterized protein with NRDE domain
MESGGRELQEVDRRHTWFIFDSTSQSPEGSRTTESTQRPCKHNLHSVAPIGMCIVFAAIGLHEEFPLIIAHNRDEVKDRECSTLHSWPDYPDIVAGRDVRLGTWMGLNVKSKKFALLTNYTRDVESEQVKGMTSRGALVSDFLKSDDSTTPESYLESLKAVRSNFNGYNLIVGHVHSSGEYDVAYYSNRLEEDGIVKLTPRDEVYGLSNHLMNTPWPKIERGKKIMKELVDSKLKEEKNPENVIKVVMEDLMSDVWAPETKDMHKTEWDDGEEYALTHSAIFVSPNPTDDITRQISVLVMSKDGTITFAERNVEDQSFRKVVS